MRRLRRSENIRKMVQETHLSLDDLVYPVFVGEGLSEPQVIESMPGIRRIPPQMVHDEMQEIRADGISAVMLFGIPKVKDGLGSAAYDQDGVVQNAIRETRRSTPDMVIMADVCMCQYTDTGHCGIYKKGAVDNDTTIQYLGEIATSYAKAGVDVVSPSAMMDGQVAAIREHLDKGGYTNVAIMAHSAKHHSSLYAPFRDAADCAPKQGDRSEYQVSYANPRQAMMEVALDIEEGVDIVMIKPAMTYLDLVAESRRRFDIPIAAYSVSGEYALVHAAHAQGMIDKNAVMLEVLGSIKRAGADIIITYFAREVSGLLR
ncbi:MAG: porphobilinogen synthase [Cenarchaeum sp. SB0665_bin_23]|nr:porphobilinogen synthase [Cenarchaeum sp. SB0667_bin_13]MXY38171.1 porphobilinogen synthase [Cenarchaeum sp. SB0664_bin_35]MXY60899.1 porphobilinogen synthase [Cenarchaeum sp. SB0665_bin_23]MXZ94094.1 porphobilinogen synthase [Cenarchaeum sp. SB0666_bin_15]MYB46769.1 porphobilinogen synthase [Cenarchaeum sp. SB0662_bin_33]MYC80098.1 porphobilinogen synthase [Cenarchaeum sp. SB0661_bin_35]MYD58609.1 porphobilinogen synthase [Cenarchaeum sp. SB0678_bin_8]MYG32456.1 porphobilinogen synthase 